MKKYEWYQILKNRHGLLYPRFFGPVWTFLYILIAISFGYVGFLYFTHVIPFVIFLPFILNIFLNVLFTPIQFGLKNNFLAMLDIIVVLETIVWFMIVIFPISPWVVYSNIPYLLWVSFATILQCTITYLNR